MSSTNTSTSDVDAINDATVTFVRVWNMFIFTFGVVGHTLSIYVFTRPSLYSNPCSRYFLASTISGCSVVGISIPLRLLQAGYKINVLTNSLVNCKILTLFFMWSKAQHAWFIMLASIDRFFCSSSSASLRTLSSLRIVSRVIPLTILTVGLAYVHVPIYFQINTRQQTCVPTQGIYQTFYGAWTLVVFSLGPPIVMLVFGLATVRNIRHSIRRIVPDNRQIRRQQRRKKADRQLIQMMFVQCIVLILTASLPSVQFIYTSLRSNVIVDTLQAAKDNLFYNIAGFVSLTVPCLSFYLFTLSSKLFRNELIKLFKGQWRCPQAS